MVCLQSVLRKVTPEDAPKISDAIMTSLLQMLSSSSGKVGGVQEDALLAVSTLIEGLLTCCKLAAAATRHLRSLLLLAQSREELSV